MVAIQDLDLVRADLLSRNLFPSQPLGRRFLLFDRIQPEKQERISFWVGERFEKIRLWLEEYRTAGPQELDVFSAASLANSSRSRLWFPHQPGCRTVAARLIESIQKFRQVVSAALSAEVAQIGKEYTQMVADGVVAAQYLQSWETSASNAVLIARRILSDVKPEFSFQFGSI